MTILIVDDNPRIRSTIRNMLMAPGVECIECDNGSMALQRYREIKPAWVLMDIMMPGVNGLDATKKIIAEYPDARIVIVTDYGDKEFRTAAAKAGAVDYVLKENLTKLRKICINEEKMDRTKK